MSSCSPDLVRAVAVGLTDVATGPAPCPVSADTVQQAESHRVEGLLGEALAQGVVHATADVRRQVHAAHLAALRTCLLVEEAAVLAFDALAAAGIANRILKGVALCRLDYAAPHERSFGDVDILIRRQDHDPALACLSAVGFHRALPAVRNGWEQRFSKAVMLIAPNGCELDLHLALAGGYFGERSSVLAPFDRPGSPFVVADRTMTALDGPDRLLHACLHAVLGGGSGLRVRRDIAQLMLVSEADWHLARQRAATAGCDVALALAIADVWTILGLPAHPAADWAQAFRPSAAQTRAVQQYRDHGEAVWAPEAISTLAALGRRDQLRFIAGLAVPSRASLDARGRTRWQHVVRLVKGLRP